MTQEAFQRVGRSSAEPGDVPADEQFGGDIVATRYRVSGTDITVVTARPATAVPPADAKKWAFAFVDGKPAGVLETANSPQTYELFLGRTRALRRGIAMRLGAREYLVTRPRSNWALVRASRTVLIAPKGEAASYRIRAMGLRTQALVRATDGNVVARVRGRLEATPSMSREEATMTALAYAGGLFLDATHAAIGAVANI